MSCEKYSDAGLPCKKACQQLLKERYDVRLQRQINLTTFEEMAANVSTLIPADAANLICNLVWVTLSNPTYLDHGIGGEMIIFALYRDPGNCICAAHATEILRCLSDSERRCLLAWIDHVKQCKGLRFCQREIAAILEDCEC